MAFSAITISSPAMAITLAMLAASPSTRTTLRAGCLRSML